MATVNKDFRIKSGLIVEGANATVNGENIITTGSSTDNLQEGTTNLYFTDQRAIDAVGGTATSASTPNTVVKRDGNGNFSANAITADLLNIGTSGTISTEGVLAIDSAAGTSTSITGNTGVEISSANGDIVLNADGNIYKGSATSGNEFTTMGRLDTYIGDGTVNGSTGNTVANRITTAENNAKSYADSLASNYDHAGSAATAEANANAYTDTAVANLVDGAPALLDTLNELAAAIADNPNYATDVANLVAGKQDTLTAGANIDITGATISVTGLDSTDISDFSTAALSATASAYDVAGAASSAETAANGYTDTAISGLSLVYEPLGASATAINALTTSDIEEGTNLYFTDARAVDAITTETIYPPAVVINNLSKQVAATQTVGTIATVNGLTWAKSEYRSAKLTVKAKIASHTQLSEILVTLDGSDNVAITEYGIVYTDAELAVVSADVSGTDVRVRVTTVNPSTDVTVVGTLLV